MEKIPQGYTSVLSVKETEKAIELLRDYFQDKFSQKMNLHRVSAPLFVRTDSGLNDGLSGKEKAVSFDITAIPNSNCEIVHSLAKWKRMALGKYGYNVGEGIYTNMNAIRRQEAVLDNLHSVYVDQWDWEKIITKDDRNFDFLKSVVRDIYSVIYDTACYVEKVFPQIKNRLVNDIYFITSEELLKTYPNLNTKERENAITKKYGAVFIMQIGENLSNGEVHDLRAPDYDDWALNGDIMVWYPELDKAIELSSMGIRVDSNSLKYQLSAKGLEPSTNYHKNVIENNYPLTIGGGIGQSRVCQLLLHKAHIGEVQSSIWDNETIEECESKGVVLL
ncbi:MAG: aspartate--ammonia ligase [Clostridia bacterium]|nr:aspartate--ammonia ligase [Clostridia bacterium]